MGKAIKQKYLNGTTSEAERAYEQEHRILARTSAAEGMVLLKNEAQLLPLQPGKSVAVYGSGAVRLKKGGTGSGDVNEREVVSIWQGLKDAGFVITNEDWLQSYGAEYDEARIKWRDTIWENAAGDDLMKFFDTYCNTRFEIPIGNEPLQTETDTAVYVLSRVAGEGADRFCEKGDYYLTDAEEEVIGKLCSLYARVVLLINTGGIVDLSFLDRYPQIGAVLYISQPGMEGGNAVADILSGKTSPSGKMTDSWAAAYTDYPGAATFSHNNQNVETEYYEEGIYVGYRYFDSCNIPVQYGFGFGLSYTTFETKTVNTELLHIAGRGQEVEVTVQVTNTGSTYAGKEVVQIYASLPCGKLEKEFRRLTAYAKTKELSPQESQTLTIRFFSYQLASFDEQQSSWIMESGSYGIWVGNSLNDSEICAVLELESDICLYQVPHICPLQKDLKEFSRSSAERNRQYETWTQAAADQKVPVLELNAEAVKETGAILKAADVPEKEEARKLVDQLTTEELIQLATGDPGKGQGSNLGAAGITVPGAAGETNACAQEKGIAAISLADGPAGLRLNRIYHVENGSILPMPFEFSLEGGFLCRENLDLPGERYYQYCTAFPVGTMLAQSWNTELVAQVGKAVGTEMQEFQVTLWLAPGMNIHRNPLCGRNFEYYSEDPLVAGMTAAAMTNGVQKNAGCGTTIKHFACNNQEDNRMGSDSIVSERALRELYLKGFEYAIRSSQPMSIMTSYNLINGIHAANNRDLCTEMARNEWGFAGTIMTDWLTTNQGPDCTAAGCMRAGNDLVMPGMQSDHDNLKQELAEGTLKLEELKDCITNLVHVVLQSNRYEGVAPYTEQFKELPEFVTVK